MGNAEARTPDIPEELEAQLVAYFEMLPKLKKKHGSVWAVIAGEKLQGTFQDFKTAARFSVDKLAGRQCLIRHTAEKRVEIPFMAIER